MRKNNLLFAFVCILISVFFGACINKGNESSKIEKDENPIQNLDSSQVSNDKLSFQGIAIDGVITEFETKLLEQGYKVAEHNEENTVYEGNFEGEKASIVVYYYQSTKKVYLCRIIIDCGTSYDKALSKFYNFKNLYKEKYEGFALNSDMLGEEENGNFSLIVSKPPVEVGSTVLGMIYLSIQQMHPSYSLQIDYQNTDTLT